MAAKHIAWFRFKDGVSDDRIDEHMRAVRTLPDVVPVVIAIECGKSFTDRGAGLTHCIVVTLPDRASLPLYLEHPWQPLARPLVARRFYDRLCRGRRDPPRAAGWGW